jgi:hypothetical protein
MIQAESCLDLHIDAGPGSPIPHAGCKHCHSTGYRFSTQFESAHACRATHVHVVVSEVQSKADVRATCKAKQLTTPTNPAHARVLTAGRNIAWTQGRSVRALLKRRSTTGGDLISSARRPCNTEADCEDLSIAAWPRRSQHDTCSLKVATSLRHPCRSANRLKRLVHSHCCCCHASKSGYLPELCSERSWKQWRGLQGFTVVTNAVMFRGSPRASNGISRAVVEAQMQGLSTSTEKNCC